MSQTAGDAIQTCHSETPSACLKIQNPFCDKPMESQLTGHSISMVPPLACDKRRSDHRVSHHKQACETFKTQDVSFGNPSACLKICFVTRQGSPCMTGPSSCRSHKLVCGVRDKKCNSTQRNATQFHRHTPTLRILTAPGKHYFTRPFTPKRQETSAFQHRGYHNAGPCR